MTLIDTITYQYTY